MAYLYSIEPTLHHANALAIMYTNDKECSNLLSTLLEEWHCRLCLRSFTPNSSEGLKHTWAARMAISDPMARLIEYSVGVHITKNDVIDQICKNCYQTVCLLSEFKAFCQDTNEVHQTLRFRKHDLAALDEYDTLVGQLLTKVKDQRNIVSYHLPKTADDETVNTVVISDDDSSLSTIPLDLEKMCNETTEGCIDLPIPPMVTAPIEHEELHFSNVNLLPEESISLEMIGEILPTAGILPMKPKPKRSRLRRHSDSVQCSVEGCEETFSTTAKRHYHEVHNHNDKNDVFVCTICEWKFHTLHDKEYHYNFVHKNKQIECEICGKLFKNQTSLKNHMLIHGKGIRCNICSKTFSKYAFNNHLAVHSDERPYPCHICDRRFKLKGHLKAHLVNKHKDLIAQPSQITL